MEAPLHDVMTTAEAKRLRKEAGHWLRELRQGAGLSQIDLAARLGFKYYTFVSQIENGFGRVPSASLVPWARCLGVPPAEFARKLLSYYDPHLYQALFEETKQ
jgi:transcriptional regulator with XRE-family HTH domain